MCETHSGASGTIWTKTLAIPSDETTMKTEIRDLQSNYSFAVALTETGAVHIYSHSTSSSVENTWGHGPLEFPHAGVRIAQVACGKTHTLLLQEDHTAIFSFGIDGHGQLGHGECSTAEVLVPRRIDALHGICVRTIAAGGWHSLVASVDGDVYTFGRDDCNQLGRMVVDVPASLPGYVDSFGEEQHIVAVAGLCKAMGCGLCHFPVLCFIYFICGMLPTRVSRVSQQHGFHGPSILNRCCLHKLILTVVHGKIIAVVTHRGSIPLERVNQGRKGFCMGCKRLWAAGPPLLDGVGARKRVSRGTDGKWS